MYDAILEEAIDAANKAQIGFIAVNGEPMYCGFAWAKITDGRHPMVNWLKKEILKCGFKIDSAGNLNPVRAMTDSERNIAYRNARKFGSKSYSKGWEFWAPGNYNGQSMSIKEVGARAFAEVLRQNGIPVSVGSRPD